MLYLGSWNCDFFSKWKFCLSLRIWVQRGLDSAWNCPFKYLKDVRKRLVFWPHPPKRSMYDLKTYKLFTLSLVCIEDKIKISKLFILVHYVYVYSFSLYHHILYDNGQHPPNLPQSRYNFKRERHHEIFSNMYIPK